MPIKCNPEDMIEVPIEMLEEIIKNGFCLLVNDKGKTKKITIKDLYLDEKDFQKLKKLVEEEESKKND